MKQKLVYWASSLVAIATIIGTTEARKELKENVWLNSEHPEVSSPKVLDQQFIIGDPTKAYWRLDMTPPVIRVGWQTDQSANSKDLTFALNPASYRANPRLAITAPF